MKKLLTLFFAIRITLFAQTPPLWMRYSAISPDGKEIAFSYMGDIYKVNTSGGKAIQLTNHQAHDTEPIWSNDGKSIAFASDRYGNFDIYLTGADGGEAVRLTFHSSADHPTDFTPDNTKIIYSASRKDNQKAVFFPTGALPEVYEVSVNGGKEKQLLSTPAEMSQFSPNGKMLISQNRKGYENAWRKHHTSSITRDIVSYNFDTDQFNKVISWDGEDRNPVWKNDSEFYYLSEKSGSFNVWKANIDGSNVVQITNFDTNPVRFLSIATDGKLCFGYDGEIYTLSEGGNPTKVNIDVSNGSQYNDSVIKSITSGASDFHVSPNGKEVAFIAHGEVFVTSIEYNVTKRITDTPEQERDLHFGPEGKKLIYSGERNGSWNIYQATLAHETDKYFYNAPVIDEKSLIATEADEFQPQFSPDGKEIAYLEERTTVRILNLASNQSRTVLDGSLNYSYSDGDQYFAWAPDSKWLLVLYFDAERWNTDVGLLNVTSKEIINLTNSGYASGLAKFAMDGEMVYCEYDKQGFRSHGSWGSQSDVYAIFLTLNAYNKFTMSKSDYELWKEDQEEEKDDAQTDSKDKKGKKGKSDEKDDDPEKIKPIKIERAGLMDRKVRLTINSSFLSDFLITNDGEQLFYTTRLEKGYHLWSTKF
jgi:Tol biopolymer transport system component